MYFTVCKDFLSWYFNNLVSTRIWSNYPFYWKHGIKIHRFFNVFYFFRRVKSSFNHSMIAKWETIIDERFILETICNLVRIDEILHRSIIIYSTLEKRFSVTNFRILYHSILGVYKLFEAVQHFRENRVIICYIRAYGQQISILTEQAIKLGSIYMVQTGYNILYS